MQEPFCFTAQQISGMTLGEIVYYNKFGDDDGDDPSAVSTNVKDFWADVAKRAERCGMTPEDYWERERAKVNKRKKNKG
jgi:hypothetical protein